MEFESRVFGQPPLHLRVLVGAIVVEDQVEFLVAIILPIQVPKELEKLLVAVAAIALASHFALRHLQCREERRGAMAHIVVRP